MSISKQSFRDALNEFYSKEELVDIYDEYLVDWIAEGYIGTGMGLFEVSLISKNSKKTIFLELLEEAFMKEETFKLIWNSLTDEMEKYI